MIRDNNGVTYLLYIFQTKSSYEKIKKYRVMCKSVDQNDNVLYEALSTTIEIWWQKMT